MFDTSFLKKSVNWGYTFGKIKEVDETKVFLKTYDEFVDVVKLVLGLALTKKTDSEIGEMFKLNIKNNVKRMLETNEVDPSGKHGSKKIKSK